MVQVESLLEKTSEVTLKREMANGGSLSASIFLNDIYLLVYRQKHFALISICKEQDHVQSVSRALGRLQKWVEDRAKERR